MKVRGRRECKDCGEQWSYYETGSVECPNCGSLRSVGIDEKTEHTATPVELDLSEHQARLPDADIEEIADDLKSTLREYVRHRGFIDAGTLLDLDDTVLTANELLQAVDIYTRMRPTERTDDDRLYVLTLIREAEDGERPASDAVPPSFHEARGLGYANAIRDYRQDLLTWLEEHPDEEARRVLGTLHEHVKRVRALEGDVPPTTAEELVRATRSITTYLHEDEHQALASAKDRLEEL